MHARLPVSFVAAGFLLLMAAGGSAAAEDLRLVEAVRNRDTTTVRALLRERVDVNAPQPDGATPLLWAVQWDDLETADLLIRAGADVGAANDYGVTPLSMACTNGSAAMVDRLLKAGADPNVALPTGETPLMTAALTGKLKVVETLLASRVDVNARETFRGQSALMWAISERHLDVARALIERGADVKTRAASGFTPLMFAARQGDRDAVTLLLAHGANVNDTAADGTSVLHVATLRGHVELAEFLLDRGAGVNADGPGYTVLHWASWIAESMMTRDYHLESGEWSVLGGPPTREARLRLLNVLLAKGANVNARLRKNPPRFGSSFGRLLGGGSFAGGTPFFLAAAVGDVEVMRLLLSHGADPLLATNGKTTPLIVAAGLATQEEETLVPVSSRVDAVKLCIELGGDVNAANDLGNTALHATAFLGFDPIARLLIERGAQVNAMNTRKETPLKIAEGFSQQAQLYVHKSTADLLRSFGGVISGPLVLPCGTCSNR